MKIAIQVTGYSGNTSQATIDTTGQDPIREGRTVLTRLVRLIERSERARHSRITITKMPANAKIPLIKLIRELTGKGLKDAKPIADEAVLGRPLAELDSEVLGDWTRGLDDIGIEYNVT